MTDKQKIQLEAIKSGKEFIDKSKLKSFIDKIKYPLYYLDFETINPAIPIFNHSKPYQHVPFQYSLHIQKDDDKNLEHFSYVNDGKNEPRKIILDHLSKLILPNGTVICYNDVFEKKCIRESVDLYPEFSDWWKSIQNNFLDLSIPFRNFYYYHQKQNASASLKSVLPALTNLNYKHLHIAEGGTANIEFLKIKLGITTVEKEIEKIRKELEEYCNFDTLAMIKVLNSLLDRVSNSSNFFS